MVIVTAVWCGGCRQLKEQVLSRPDVRASAKRFVCLEVDGDNQADLKKRLNVSGYPTIVFFDSSGRESSRVQGAVPYQMLLREMDSAAHSAS
jgi:thiol:disulfide interchange protein